MKKFLVLLFMGLGINAFAQNIRLSEHAQVSVITCGPSQGEVYSAFGHSAFRVYDPSSGIDEAYNYGIFDFNQPHFYLNFTRGYLKYKLGVYDYQQFKNYYIYNNRYIHEQILNLTPEQKQKVYAYLQWNALPENENYYYDYFYNNCSTKMRDVLATVFKDDVRFDGSYVKTNYSIRELTDLYLKQQPWGDLGIDIGLGLPMDKKATPYEYMFLPDFLEAGLNHATIKHDGVSVPLVKEDVNVYKMRAEEPAGLLNPIYIFSGIALICIFISVRDFKRRRLTMWFDGVLFGVCGFLGCLLFLLWTATDHKAAAKNFNLLWALPTHLFAVILFIKQPKVLERYFLVTTIIGVLLLVSWPLLPQKLHYSLWPLVLGLAIRAFTQYRLRQLEVV